MSSENYDDVLEEIYGGDADRMQLDRHLKAADQAIDEAVTILEKVKDVIESHPDIEKTFDDTGVLQDMIRFIDKYALD